MAQNVLEVIRKIWECFQGVFLFHRKLYSYEIKTLREDRTAADRKMPLSRPAAGGKSCFAGFFLMSANSNFLPSSHLCKCEFIIIKKIKKNLRKKF